MNTAQIVDSCRALPGVTVQSEPDGAALRLESAQGSGSMRFFSILPGLSLAQIAVDAPVWPAPQPERCTPEARGPLIVNYCLRGRCELILNDNRHVFLAPGQISLTERFAQKEYLYPGKVYAGVELFIDPEAAARGVPLLREVFGVDLPSLAARYCPDGQTYLAKLPLPEALLARLTDGAADDAARAGRKTGVIDLLAFLQGIPAPQQTPQPVYYTRSQVEIARRIEQTVMDDLARQHTAREFAAQFSISESSVKNYFSGVFGQSISQYTAHRRMELAARLLTQTRLSVIEVAARAGYCNQSKFSAAFRRVYGCAPLEFRRKRNISGQS